MCAADIARAPGRLQAARAVAAGTLEGLLLGHIDLVLHISAEAASFDHDDVCHP